MRPHTAVTASPMLMAANSNQQMGLVPDLRAVAELERIEEVAVPQVEPVEHQQLQHRDPDQERDQPPGEPRRRPVPEAPRALPEAAQQAVADEWQESGVGHGWRILAAGEERQCPVLDMA